MKHNTGLKKSGLLALGWAMTTAASIIVAPLLLDKYSNKQYKSKLRHDNSNIADLHESGESDEFDELEDVLDSQE